MRKQHERVKMVDGYVIQVGCAGFSSDVGVNDIIDFCSSRIEEIKEQNSMIEDEFFITFDYLQDDCCDGNENSKHVKIAIHDDLECSNYDVIVWRSNKGLRIIKQ